MLKQIRQFVTENLPLLSKQLSTLENNVAAETASIRADTMPGMRVLSFSAAAPLRSFTVGQLALCDTTTGNLVLTLDRPGVPGFATFAKQVAANTLTIAPAGTSSGVSVKINQAASIAIANVGLYWLYFDGVNWLVNS
ncbi:hypothetical protein [Nevskia sp.]|uniref:hypothetical protein n=1 Tax=Nevskia sp. TaxID=1929292 RepID=UPI0025ED71A8|nr:hypothetical protein [Nevskia sp.]